MNPARRPQDRARSATRHALEGLEPADAWDEVTARAGRPELAQVDGSPATPSRRPVLVAAAVLVVGLVAGLVALDRGGDHGRQQVRAGEPPAGEPAGEAPEGIWGRSWRVTRLVEDGVELGPAVDLADEPIVFDLGAPGSLSYRVCNTTGSAVLLEGDRLRLLGGVTTAMGCVGALGDQEHWIDQVLRAGPEVELRGDELTLRADGAEIALADASASHPPTAPRPGIDDSGPDAFWGPRWTLFGVRVDEQHVDVVTFDGRPPAEVWPELDASDPGTVAIHGCNTLSSPASLDGEVLRWAVDGAVTTTGAACEGAAGDQDRLLREVLAARPQVVVRGTFLYLVTDEAVVTFMDRDG